MPVSTFIHKLKQRFKKPTTKLVVVGLHYSAHQFIEAAHKSGKYQVLAVVNNEPWLHKTDMLGAKVIYPVELAAFAERHKVKAIIDFKETNLLSRADIDKLTTSVNILQLDTQETPQRALSKLANIN